MTEQILEATDEKTGHLIMSGFFIFIEERLMRLCLLFSAKKVFPRRSGRLPARELSGKKIFSLLFLHSGV